MIKLKNLIDGTARNPFTGELYEGLIRSIDVDKSINFVNNAGFYTIKIDNNSFGAKIECWYKEKTDGEIYFAGAVFETQFSKLYRLINNLGYYIAKIKTASIGDRFEDAKNHSVESDFDVRNVVKKYKPHIVYFMFEKKYDELFSESLSKLLYHVTRFDKIKSIQKIGLKPVAGSKRGYHPERIYFALTKQYADEMWSHLMYWHIDAGNGAVLTIDTSKLQKNTNFYIDPNFINKGVYTYNSIPKLAIVSIEKY